jgi:hypothetical protein
MSHRLHLRPRRVGLRRCDQPDTTKPGACSPYCDPSGGDAGAACGSGEVCEQVSGKSYGFCRKLDQLCFSDDDCYGIQACLVEGNDLNGRCVDGCTSNGDCASGDECVIHSGTRGVCRASGAACSPSTNNIQPLRGDAQCISSEICSSTQPNVLGTRG